MWTKFAHVCASLAGFYWTANPLESLCSLEGELQKSCPGVVLPLCVLVKTVGIINDHTETEVLLWRTTLLNEDCRLSAPGKVQSRGMASAVKPS